MDLNIIMNAAMTGLGAGIGSYYGTKIASKTDAHIKKIMGKKDV